MSTLYESKPWREYRSRILSVDAECALAHLTGGCRGTLHVHHIEPIAEGGPEFPRENGVAVLCARHHSLVHSWRKRQEPQRKRCPHNHPYAWARLACEAKLNKEP